MFFWSKVLLAIVLFIIFGQQIVCGEGKETFSTRQASLDQIDNLARQGAFSKAKEELNSLLREYPNDARVHLIAARFFGTIGANSSALAEYRKAIELGATGSESLAGLAQIYLSNLDNQQALHYAQKALALEPSCKQARIVLIAALLNMGKLDQAGQKLANLFAGGKDASDADLNYLAYRLTRERRQLMLAKQCLNDAIKLRPQQTKWLLDQADLYWSLADESNDSSQRMPNYRAARRSLEAYLALEPRSPEGLYKLGEILEFHFHDYDSAENQYEKILAIDPDHVAAIAGLDRCKSKKNDLAGQMKAELWKNLRQLREGLFNPYRNLQ